MPLVFLLTLLLSPAIGLAQIEPKPIESPLKTSEYEELLKSNLYCSTLSTADICRFLPWTLRPDEGVIEHGSLAIIVVRENPPETHEFNRMLFGVLKERRHEVYASLLISSDAFSAALTRSGYTSIMVVIRSSSQKNVAALLASRIGLLQFIGQYAQQWRTVLPDAVGWEPAKDFVPFYQFDTF